jgi:hypothetical protein
MIESEIQDLARRDGAIDLQGLEADIWAREAEIRASRRAGRTLASLQAAVVALAVVTSAALGTAMVRNTPVARQANLLNPGASLAPSALLFGGHR